MDALSISSAGLSAATSRYTAAASAIAGGTGDIAAQLTELSLAKVAVEASASVVRTSSDLSKQLVDMLV